MAAFAKCLRERMIKNELLLFDWNGRRVFVKSEFISEGFRPSLDDLTKSLNVSSFEDCKMSAA